MREILFRGKRIDNGKWVNGYVTRIKHSDDKGNVESYYFNALDEMGWVAECVVSAETVCQYTGLIDKNGRKIFEGDILEVCTFGFNPERFITEVIYEKCAFRLKNGRNMFYYGQSDFTKMDDAKVVGNVFDNPELIGDKH